MRCIEISKPGDADVLQLAQRPAPDCGASELLIKVTAAGLNRADILQRKGLYPPPAGASDLPGLEVSGVVEAVGSEVAGWREGDRVCALTSAGGYAEYVNVPAGQCLPIPSRLSLLEAAALPEALFTVWMAVFQIGQLQPGERLLVHGGSSGIGVTAIQMAKAFGCEVYVTAGSERKCQACLALGADLSVNYREQDFVEAIKTATAKQGVDVVLDMVGGDYIEKNMKLAAVDGRIVNIGYQAGIKARINFAPMINKRLVLTASTLRSQTAEAKAALANTLLMEVWPRLESEEIKPVIDSTFPLTEAAAAHRLMESSMHIGKILLVAAE